MRDKLIELIRESHCVDVWNYYTDDFKKPNPVTKLADHLLANGILIPPCKPGDDIWWVNEQTKTVECQKGGIKAVCWDGKEWSFVDTDDVYNSIGGQWSCLTKEDAEKFLEGVE